MGIYTASLWTLITSSANVPPFDENVYTLKATIDDTSHTMPGNPYLYPVNLQVGQNLFNVFTAPSGANQIELLCISTSIEQDFFTYGCPYQNSWIIRTDLRSGSCQESGSANWQGLYPLEVYVIGIDSNNNYYYTNTSIPNGADTAFVCVDVAFGQSLVSVDIDIIAGVPIEYEVIPCGACGQPNQLYFDVEYAVVVPKSVTSSIFPAELIDISGSNYAIKVSSSADGLIANVDMGISWITASDIPVYYTASFGAVYYSTAISASVQRNDCPSGEEGSFVLYTLPVSYSSSPISQIDAQNSASAYFNSTSQSYANTYGTCTPTGSAGITLEIYGQYNGTDAEVEYRVNGGSWNYIGYTLNQTCDILVLVGGLSEADSIEIQPVGLVGVISGTDTGACPGSASGCGYNYTVGPNLLQSVYITVDGSISC